jgi:hypothetical protein
MVAGGEGGVGDLDRLGMPAGSGSDAEHIADAVLAVAVRSRGLDDPRPLSRNPVLLGHCICLLGALDAIGLQPAEERLVNWLATSPATRPAGRQLLAEMAAHAAGRTPTRPAERLNGRRAGWPLSGESGAARR